MPESPNPFLPFFVLFLRETSHKHINMPVGCFSCHPIDIYQQKSGDTIAFIGFSLLSQRLLGFFLCPHRYGLWIQKRFQIELGKGLFPVLT